MPNFSCPWDGMPLDTFPTCEATLCGWIKQPANTVSNLAFFAAATFLLSRSRKNHSGRDAAIGACAAVIGVCSSLAHASMTEIFGFFDFASIFLLFSLLVTLGLTDLGFVLSRLSQALLVAGTATVSILSMYSSPLLRVPVFVLFVLILMTLEIRYLRSRANQRLSRAAIQPLLALGIGALALGVDASGSACATDSHIFQFHSAWHIFTALGIVAGANYFAQKRQNYFVDLANDPRQNLS